jgi:hypothetical protein
MTKKEDADRPHYYSQFWLDVAAGRRVIGTPKTNEAEEADFEPEAEPILHKAGPTTDRDSSDGYAETIAHPEVEPDFDEAEELVEPDLYSEEIDLDNEVTETEMPDLAMDEPDLDFVPPTEEEEDFLEEEEEEEEDTGWGGGRGRKKPKGRQTRQPKKTKRDSPRRGH